MDSRITSRTKQQTKQRAQLPTEQNTEHNNEQRVARVSLWARQEQEPEKCTLPRTKHRTKHCPQSHTEQNMQQNIGTNKLEQDQNRTQQAHRTRFGTKCDCWQIPNMFHRGCRTSCPNNAEQRCSYTLVWGPQQTRRNRVAYDERMLSCRCIADNRRAKQRVP